MTEAEVKACVAAANKVKNDPREPSFTKNPEPYVRAILLAAEQFRREGEMK
jgi:hypothetical protein